MLNPDILATNFLCSELPGVQFIKVISKNISFIWDIKKFGLYNILFYSGFSLDITVHGSRDTSAIEQRQWMNIWYSDIYKPTHNWSSNPRFTAFLLLLPFLPRSNKYQFYSPWVNRTWDWILDLPHSRQVH